MLLLGARYLLSALGISQGYLYLFYVDVIAAGMQVLVMAILNVFFYLDQRRIALGISVLFLVSNTAFTLAT